MPQPSISQPLVLVINSGSSSLKFAVVEPESGNSIITGLGECFGLPQASFTYKLDGEKIQVSLNGDSDPHLQTVEKIVELVKENGWQTALVAVGHRVVHGGEKFTETVKLDSEIVEQIAELSSLAPLHNPAGVKGIKAAMSAFAELPQFAVFDTAFHQSMPEKAFREAVPQALYQEMGIRRYGFHGTSHYFVSRESAKLLNQDVESLKQITVHLGNGASICAVKEGKSVDTSMGFTPLAGLMMGTRSGDLDPGIIEFLFDKGWSKYDIFTTLNKKSGILGVFGPSSDARDLLQGVEEGDKNAQLAVDIFCYRIAKYIASYLVSLGGLDAIVFTGGIGENAAPIRSQIIRELSALGFVENEQCNLDARFGQSGVIGQSELLNAKLVVVPTDEELVIARQSLALSQ